MLLDISELLDDPFFIQSVEFGIVTRDITIETEVKATHDNTNVQPASADVLQRLEVGERSKPSMQVFTKQDFPIKNGDYMYFNGQKWRCVTDENWSQYGYWDAIFQLYSGAQDPDNPTPDPWG